MGLGMLNAEVRCPGCRSKHPATDIVDTRRAGDGASDSVALCIGCFNRTVLVLDALGYDPKAVIGEFRGTNYTPSYIFYAIEREKQNR